MPANCNLDLVKKVLREYYVPVVITTLNFQEDLNHSLCKVCLQLDTGIVLTGEGVGLIDSVFNCLKNYYSKEYKSLKSILLVDIRTKLKGTGTTATGDIGLEIKNSEGRKFYFSHESTSLTASAVICVAQCLEFFINSERAFVRLYNSIQDSEKRNRQDLKSRFISEISEVVKSTSYADVLQKMKDDLKI